MLSTSQHLGLWLTCSLHACRAPAVSQSPGQIWRCRTEAAPGLPSRTLLPEATKPVAGNKDLCEDPTALTIQAPAGWLAFKAQSGGWGPLGILVAKTTSRGLERAALPQVLCPH